MDMVVAFCYMSVRTCQLKSSTVIFHCDHLNVITKTLVIYYCKYENVVFLGDFNAGTE